MTTQPRPASLFRRTDSLLETPHPAQAQPVAGPMPLPASYRPDIDGMRALAVVAVALFHAEVPGFGGGYVGVDVFFVISGYLITRLLAGSEADSPWPWLKRFYIRRGRRILPALLVTSITVAVPASLLLLPFDLADFGKYLAATPIFLSNLAAWNEAGYFNLVGYSPLMHFWSLAVEEQFYLAYPLVLLLLSRYSPRHRVLALIALTMASFAVCVWGSYYKPRANFFLAPTRAWEFLLGALVASRGEHWNLQRNARESLSVAAGVTLALAIGLYHSRLKYPGLAGLAPCMATAILIATNTEQPSLVGKVLRWRPLVFTGLVSYSFYLWHLPVLVLLKYYNIWNLGTAGRAVALLVSYALAVVSWRLIEKPVRERMFLRSDRTFLLTAAALSVILLATGFSLWQSGGLPRRFNYAEVPGDWMDEAGQCALLPYETIASGGLCSYGPRDAQSALVWGDSHAMALMPAYEKLATSYGMRVYLGVRYGCQPLLRVTSHLHGSNTPDCRMFNSAVARAIDRLNPRLVILNGHWDDKDEDLVADADVTSLAGTAKFRFGLEQTLKRIGAQQRSVCVVLDVPNFKYLVPLAVVMARRRGLSTDFLQISRAEALEQLKGPEQAIRALQQEHLFSVVDPKDVLCHTGWCAFQLNGNTLYGDTNHLAPNGARAVASTIEGCFSIISQTSLAAARRE